MMGEAQVYLEELLDYEEVDNKVVDGVSAAKAREVAKKSYVGIHSSVFNPELLRAIQGLKGIPFFLVVDVVDSSGRLSSRCERSMQQQTTVDRRGEERLQADGTGG